MKNGTRPRTRRPGPGPAGRRTRRGPPGRCWRGSRCRPCCGRSAGSGPARWPSKVGPTTARAPGGPRRHGRERNARTASGWRGRAYPRASLSLDLWRAPPGAPVRAPRWARAPGSGGPGDHWARQMPRPSRVRLAASRSARPLRARFSAIPASWRASGSASGAMAPGRARRAGYRSPRRRARRRQTAPYRSERLPTASPRRRSSCVPARGTPRPREPSRVRSPAAKCTQLPTRGPPVLPCSSAEPPPVFLSGTVGQLKGQIAGLPAARPNHQLGLSAWTQSAGKTDDFGPGNGRRSPGVRLRATVFSNLDGLFAFHVSAEDGANLPAELGGGLDEQHLLELGPLPVVRAPDRRGHGREPASLQPAPGRTAVQQLDTCPPAGQCLGGALRTDAVDVDL